MATTLPELEHLLSALAASSRVTKYYPAGHPQIEESLGRVLGQIAALVAKGSPLMLSVLPDGLYVGPTRVFLFSQEDTLFGNLSELGVRELTLNPGIDSEELLHLVEILSQDPKKTWEKGGIIRALRQHKALHISITASDLTAGERQATLDSLRVMTTQERVQTVAMARKWLDEDGPLRDEDEVLRIVALLRDNESFREIIDAPGPEGHDRRRIKALVRLWGVVAKSGLTVPGVETAIAAEMLSTDARTLMDAALDVPNSPPLQKLLERLDPEIIGDMIAARVETAMGDATGWLASVDGLFPRAGARRTILYRILQRIRHRPDATDTVAFLEDELVGGTREESAFLALMRGALTRALPSPSSWSARWGSGVLVRRATGLLERVGLSEEQRIRWLSMELERLVVQQDIAGVLEVLEAVRDRHSPQGEADAPCVVSRDAHRSLPPFLKTVSPAERIRTIKALARVDGTWRELVGRLLDLAEGDELRQFAAELESIHIAPKDLVWEIMRSENPEDIARAIRITGVLAGNDDRLVLAGFLQHGNPAIRLEAIKVLARVAPTDLLAHVPALLRDPNPLVSTRALSEIQGLPGASACLMAAVAKGVLRAVSEELGIALVQCVAAHGTPEQKTQLAASVREPRFVGKAVPPRVREAAAALLGDCRPRGILERLKVRPGQRNDDA